MTIIIGDMNPKIGKVKCGDLIGDYGIGVRNKHGETMKTCDKHLF